MDLSHILEISPYQLCQSEKEAIMIERLKELSKHHYLRCPEYTKIIDGFGIHLDYISSSEEIPFLPVNIFKDFEMMSISREDVFKTLTSSGTSGQSVSKIYLDKEGALYQQKTLSKIIASFLGGKRIPMLIIDCPSVVKNREMFSARGAGILGYSIFGSDRTYALTDDMQLDIDAVRKFLEKHDGEKIFVFGFTFMIWQYFYSELCKLKKKGILFDLSKAIMIHGGGWKKLINESVAPEKFRSCLKDICGICRIHDYYGMVEQTGTVYMECECNNLHTSIFSDVLMRRTEDFSVCDRGEPGIVQVLSMLPQSYPGHSILTEDRGVICGEDDCPCGRKGKYFKILGRIKDAEIRGCSDTYERT